MKLALALAALGALPAPAHAECAILELVPQLPAPEPAFAEMVSPNASDAWRTALAERVLQLEGFPG